MVSPREVLQLAGYGVYAGVRIGWALARHVRWLVRHRVLDGGDPR